MGTGARVENIESLKTLKVALVKCAEKITAALEDSESDIQRTLNWLENEQPTYWASQLRKRHDALEKAKEALRMKKLYKDATGRTPSAVDEERALAAAKRRMDEAEQKAIATKQWARRMQKEMLLYKGQVMRMVTACSTDIPAAAAQLNNIMLKLDEYMAVGPVEVASSAEGGAGGMTRSADARPGDASPLAKLRQRTPAALVREAAQRIDPGDIQWQSGVLLDADQAAISALGLKADPVDPGERVICAPDVWNATSVYFERAVRLPDGSSWYIGPAGDDAAPVTACVALSMGDLLRTRPDLGALFTVPVGFLLALAAGTGVRAMLNQQNRNVLGGGAAKATATPGQ